MHPCARLSRRAGGSRSSQSGLTRYGPTAMTCRGSVATVICLQAAPTCKNDRRACRMPEGEPHFPACGDACVCACCFSDLHFTRVPAFADGADPSQLGYEFIGRRGCARPRATGVDNNSNTCPMPRHQNVSCLRKDKHAAGMHSIFNVGGLLRTSARMRRHDTVDVRILGTWCRKKEASSSCTGRNASGARCKLSGNS